MNKPESEQDQKKQQTEHKQQNTTLIKKLVLAVFAMFGFGFALVPLYNVFCDVTGLNGKTNSTAAEYTADGIDTSRNIRVQFISHVTSGMPWKFYPITEEVTVHPGEIKLVKFYAKNNANKEIVGQAVPSISPGTAHSYFQKIECFCFNQQPLKAHQEVEMAVQFYIDADLPKDITTVTLSYTLFNVTEAVKASVIAKN
ncbi:MAG: cytochrome c oxidase assembly protein [Alteromonadaceae bacterium]|nr:cytochrome c oxidase assembly protein [Alteromonadaceae bacterium]